MKDLSTQIAEFSLRRTCDKEKLPSGLPSFDLVVGGIAKGEFTEVYDIESSIGKTSFALCISKTVTNSKGIVLYFSLEQELKRSVLEKHGIDPNYIAVCNVGNTEGIVSITEEIKPDLVVIDSLSSVLPEDVEYKYSQLRKTLRELREVTYKRAPILMLNQSRSAINRIITTGGEGIEQWSDLRIKLSSTGVIFKRFIPTGRNILMTMYYKNNPTEKLYVKTNLMFETGFDPSLDLLELATSNKVIERYGSHYIFNKIDLGKSKEECTTRLRSNQELFDKVYSSLKLL